jgi:hypothetical protein
MVVRTAAETGAESAVFGPSSGVSLALARARMRLGAGEQRARFRRLAGEFGAVYASLARHDIGRFVTPLWEEFNARLEGRLLPRPGWRFLRDSTIKRTMFVDARGAWLASQASYLLARVGLGELSRALPDPGVGDPPLAWARFRASHNSVHHLTHLERYREATGFDAARAGSIVEWGGGYGNLARMVWRLAEVRGVARPTYTIIDTPLLCALQRLYLASVFGADRVRVLGDAGAGVAEGCFNIVPVGLVESVRPRGEIFISTWALSESSAHAQDRAAREWFGGRLLLSAQGSSAELPDAGRIPVLAERAGAVVVPVAELPGNTYCFR